MFFIAAFAFLCLGTFCQETRRFPSDINNLAISAKEIFVATDNYLYKLNHRLDVEVEEALVLNKSQFNRVKILLVWEESSTLVLCGTGDTGACEMRDLHNVSNITVKKKYIVPTQLNGSAVGFIYDNHGKKYLAVGTFATPLETSPEIVTLRSLEGTANVFTMQEDGGGSSPSIKPGEIAGVVQLEFVDGFQIKNYIYFLINMQVNSSYSNVTLFRMEITKEGKRAILDSLYKTAVLCYAGKPSTKLLASTLLLRSGDSALWVGVFSAVRTGDSDSTALGLFDLENMTEKCSETEDSGFHSFKKSPCYFDLKPIIVPLVHAYITAIAATTVHQWTILFIGTAQGKVLKISMDKDRKTSCLVFLYQFSNRGSVFYKMLIDPAQKLYVYAAAKNEFARIKVANCEKYSSMRSCWSAQDPHCGWCTSLLRCTFLSECKDSHAVWISIPNTLTDSTQMISYEITKAKNGTEQVLSFNMKAQVSVHYSGNRSFSCQVSILNNENVLCEEENVSFPNCSCSFPSVKLPLKSLCIKLNFRIDSWNIVETLSVDSSSGSIITSYCLDCPPSGCRWCTKKQQCFLSIHP
ncbi:PLXC1 protein, partial [Polypterus senegalus]|nr:PLXC1 protein [Polypterus senegalus]